jgi:hypothetical protein
MSRSTPFTVTIEQIARHRNGVFGEPFHVVLFRDPVSRKLAVVFGQPNHVAVLDLEHAHRGEIRFGFNSFRGDVYEPLLRDAITRFETNQDA